jgi:trehalose 6-phosphate phosphatase
MARLILHGEQALDKCVSAVAGDPAATALFCDIDGTISPIVADPYAAVVPEEFRAALAQLAPRLGLLAFVTGRDVCQGRDMVGIHKATYVGTHGLETVLADGAARTDPAAEIYVDDVQSMVRRAEALDAARLGLVLENKRTVLAVHYRRAADARATRAILEEQIVAPARALGLIISTGHFLVEVRPPVVASKGTATSALLAGGDFRTALFLGDDLTDCTGFAAVREWAAADGGSSRRTEDAPARRVDDTLAPPARLACAIAAITDETPQEVAHASDVRVAATPGVYEVLTRLVAAVG